MGRSRKPKLIRQGPEREMTAEEAQLAAEAAAYAASDAAYEQYAEPEAAEDLGPPPSVRSTPSANGRTRRAKVPLR